MSIYKSPEAIEIERYLKIINGTDERTIIISENRIDNNILYFGNVQVEDTLLYEDGTRWIKILEENTLTEWIIDIGYINSQADERCVVDKSEISSMLHNNMLYHDETSSSNQICESQMIVSKFDIFLEKIDCYLLKNYNTTNNAYNINWKKLYNEGYLPSVAAECAIIYN